MSSTLGSEIVEMYSTQVSQNVNGVELLKEALVELYKIRKEKHLQHINNLIIKIESHILAVSGEAVYEQSF